MISPHTSRETVHVFKFICTKKFLKLCENYKHDNKIMYILYIYFFYIFYL